MGASISRIPVKFIIEGKGEAEGELIRFLAPRTVEAILRRLPIDGRVALLDGGVYFEVPIKMGQEKAKPVVDAGTVAYWPMSSALCVFYDRAKPHTPVNIVGRITKNLELFRNVKSGTKIVLVKI